MDPQSLRLWYPGPVDLWCLKPGDVIHGSLSPEGISSGIFIRSIAIHSCRLEVCALYFSKVRRKMFFCREKSLFGY